VVKQAGGELEAVGVGVPGLLEVRVEQVGAASGAPRICRVGSRRRSPSIQTLRGLTGPAVQGPTA